MALNWFCVASSISTSDAKSAVPATVNAPLASRVPVTVVTPVTSAPPPTNRFLATPTPPANLAAPVVELED